MKKVWFVRKRYGWGLSPATWQGWLTVFLYIVGIWYFAIQANQASGITALYRVGIPVVILSVIFLVICYTKGEKPLRWQWGNTPKE
jgi:hypothetical protein